MGLDMNTYAVVNLVLTIIPSKSIPFTNENLLKLELEYLYMTLIKIDTS
jgi:hypothetical protein